MAKEKRVESQGSMTRLILCATVASGVVSVYLMYRRGDFLRASINPVGSLVTEVKNAV